MEHATPAAQVLLPLFSIIIVAMILTARRRNLYIRRIHGLNAIDEAVGRATEMGRPMLCTTGASVNTQGGIEIVPLQALSIVSYILRASAPFSNRAIIPVYDPQMLAVTQEAVQNAYLAAGKPELYNPDDVRFLTNRQFAYAAAVSGIMHREKVAASFLFGYFYAEAMIFAETGQQVGAIQIAGTTATTQIPFFIAACDYVIIGDEFYAASAYLSREPTQLGSIVGQDICKAILLGIAVIGTLLVSIGNLGGYTWVDTFVKLFK